MARTKTVGDATDVKVANPEVAQPAEKPVKKTSEKKTDAVKKAPKVKKEKTEVAAGSNPVTVTTKATLTNFATILRPVITEKTMKGIEKASKVTVEVSPNANKTAVKLAFEATYKVKVKKVNILNVRAKYTRRGQHPGTISGFKKAIVTLVSGQALDLFKE
jgi:large subunit ribosomal protein L23